MSAPWYARRWALVLGGRPRQGSLQRRSDGPQCAGRPRAAGVHVHAGDGRGGPRGRRRGVVRVAAACRHLRRRAVQHAVRLRAFHWCVFKQAQRCRGTSGIVMFRFLLASCLIKPAWSAAFFGPLHEAEAAQSLTARRPDSCVSEQMLVRGFRLSKPCSLAGTCLHKGRIDYAALLLQGWRRLRLRRRRRPRRRPCRPRARGTSARSSAPAPRPAAGRPCSAPWAASWMPSRCTSATRWLWATPCSMWVRPSPRLSASASFMAVQAAFDSHGWELD